MKGSVNEHRKTSHQFFNALIGVFFLLCTWPVNGFAQDLTADDFGFGDRAPSQNPFPTLLIVLNFEDPEAPEVLPEGIDSGILEGTLQYWDDFVFQVDGPNAKPNGVNNYFVKNSNGYFRLERAGAIQLDLPLSERFYKITDGKDDPALVYHTNIIRRAMEQGAFNNFSRYDTDHNGHLDSSELLVLIIAKGEGGGVRTAGPIKTGDSDITWSGSVAASHIGIIGKTYDPTLPDDGFDNFQEMYHEMAHLLHTIDLYGIWTNDQTLDPKEQSARTLDANLSLMSTGHVYLDPWHKMKFGWIYPKVYPIQQFASAKLFSQQVGGYNSDVILYDPTRGTDEFFMLEYRTKNSNGTSGHDQHVPGSGLAVWHVSHRLESSVDYRVERQYWEVAAPEAENDWFECKWCRNVVRKSAFRTLPCSHPDHATHEPQNVDKYSNPLYGYHIVVNNPEYPGSRGWSACHKCGALFHLEDEGSSSCPAGGQHSPESSGDQYTIGISADSLMGHHAWHQCTKCQSLYFNTSRKGEEPGLCAVDGLAHDKGPTVYSLLANWTQPTVLTLGAPDLRVAGNSLWGSGSVTPQIKWYDGQNSSLSISVRPFAVGDRSIDVSWWSNLVIKPGDGGDCKYIGDWDAATSTCTVTQNIKSSITIAGDGITLKGVGPQFPVIAGDGEGVAISVIGRTGVAIRDFAFRGWQTAIKVANSDNISVVRVDIDSQMTGILFDNVTGSKILDSEFRNAETAVQLQNNSSGNFFNGLQFNQTFTGFYTVDSNSSTVDTCTFDGGFAGVVVRRSNDNAFQKLEFENVNTGISISDSAGNNIDNSIFSNNLTGGVKLENAANGRISGCTFSGSPDAVNLIASPNNTIKKNTLTHDGTGNGIHSENAINNVFEDNTIKSFNIGMILMGSNGSQVHHNLITDNTQTGLYLSSYNLSVRGNFFKNNNEAGLFCLMGTNNTIVANNFAGNGSQVKGNAAFGSSNRFTDPVSGYGNSWDDWDEEDEGCFDADANGICDAAYDFGIGQDTLPVIPHILARTARVEADEAGGDCAWAAGTWSAYDRRCMLNRDLAVVGGQNALELGPDVFLLGYNDYNGKKRIMPLPFAATGAGYGVFVNAGDSAIIKKLNIEGFGAGIRLLNSANVLVQDCTLTGGSGGLFASGADNLTMQGSSVTSNTGTGVELQNSSDGAILANAINGNGSYGFLLQNGSNGNTLRDNAISDNQFGLAIMVQSYNNLIFNNNFGTNTSQAAVLVGAGHGNLFQDSVFGGNFWVDYHLPTQGCNDTDSDGFCDAPYDSSVGSIIGAQDDKPLTSAVAVAPFVLRNDATGGDCQLIGIWSEVDRTCTLTTDILLSDAIPHGGIRIEDSLVLNGNGHSISGCTKADCYGVQIAADNVTAHDLILTGLLRGIALEGASYCVVRENELRANVNGMYMSYSSSAGATANVAFRNNFIDNGQQLQMNMPNTEAITNRFYDFSAAGNGGNYWSDYDSPAEGCNNTNDDLYCDSPLVLKYPTLPPANQVRDIRPFTVPNGWETISPQVVNVLPGGLVKPETTTLTGTIIDLYPSSGIDFDTTFITLHHAEGGTDSDITSACEITDTGFSCPLSGLGYGDYDIGGRVYDRAGNFTVISGKFWVRTYRLRDNLTGGDCPQIGSWDGAGKICTMNRDLLETHNGNVVEMIDGMLTLDGAGHAIRGNPALTTGVSFYGKTSTQIRNLLFEDLVIGISIYRANNGNIEHNQFRKISIYGLQLFRSDNNFVVNNTFAGSGRAVQFNDASRSQVLMNEFRGSLSDAVFLDSGSQDNQIWDNGFRYNGGSQLKAVGNVSNLFMGLRNGALIGNYWDNFDESGEGCLDAAFDGFCDSPYFFTGGQDDYPLRGGFVIQDDTTGGDCSSIGQWIDAPSGGECVLGRDLDRFNIWVTEGIKINGADITLDGNRHALSGHALDFINYSWARQPSAIGVSANWPGVVVKNLEIYGFTNGIQLGNSAAGAQMNANYLHDNLQGMYLKNSNNTTVSGNVLQGCLEVGLLVQASNTSIFHNAFIDNAIQVSLGSGYTGNILNLSAPEGGNYWSQMQGCPDSNGDDFCDGPAHPAGGFVVGGQDDLPLTFVPAAWQYEFDEDGGDCLIYGSWDASSGTCSMWRDLKVMSPVPDVALISMTQAGLRLEGNGHKIGNHNPGVGVGINAAARSIRVQNLAINDFSMGILSGGSNLELMNLLFENNTGWAIAGSDLDLNNFRLTDSFIRGGNGGIFLPKASLVLIENNTFENLSGDGIRFGQQGGGNMLAGNTIRNVSGVGIRTMPGFSGFGSLSIINNNLSNNGIGIGLNNIHSFSPITGNNITGSSSYGLLLQNTSDVQVTYNNFVNNEIQAQVTNDVGSVFHLVPPHGGNFWSDYHLPEQGCDNFNAPPDTFCDAPYLFSGGQDNYPWTTYYGWEPNAPKINLATPSGILLDDKVNIRVSYEDTQSGIDISAVTVTLDGSELSGCAITENEAYCPAVQIGYGQHTIGGSVADRVGNVTPISNSFIVNVHVLRTDGGDCSLIGSWQSASSTCLMNSDITLPAELAAGIKIVGPGITLNGNGHRVRGQGTISQSEYGVGVFKVNNTIIKNLILDGLRTGIFLGGTQNTVVNGNTLTRNALGLKIEGGNGNTVFNNSFTENTHHVRDYADPSTVFNSDLPIGGNYWDTFDAKTEGCLDEVVPVGICDRAYEFSYDIGTFPNVSNITTRDLFPLTIPFVPDVDADGDGYPASVEKAAGSDPLNPYSIPVESSLFIRGGYNLVSFSAEVDGYGDLRTVMKSLGGPDIITKVLVPNAKGDFMESGYKENQFYGDNPKYEAGSSLPGMIIYGIKDMDNTLPNTLCHSWNLHPGVNIVGTYCADESLTAFGLLPAIGDETVVNSIQRFNPVTGLFETAAYDASGNISGVDFPIRKTEAYYIHMLGTVKEFLTHF